MKKLFYCLLILISSFFILQRVFSANSDIVINEIGAYPTSTHEWIEIWNKGSDPVDMAGWKFWENSTNHGLAVSTTDSVVGPGEYAAICQDSEQFLSDNSGFPGSVFDSTWGSLSESGEEIGLKDNGGNFVEQFTYVSAPEHSLERANPFISDYTAANWQINSSGNSLGLINSNFRITTTSVSTSTSESSSTAVSTSTVWPQIKINEFVSDPETGNEWVEFYNSATNSLDLSGGYICDNRNTTSSCKSLSGTAEPSGWFIFDLGTASYLNNDGDSVILKNPEGTEMDSVVYGGSFIPEKGQSLARHADGIDTDNNSDWSVTTDITRGSANHIVAPAVPVSNSGGSSPAVDLPKIMTATGSPVLQTTSSVVINELFPYPDEDDEEFIEIRNTESTTVNLAGWKIADKTRNFALSGGLGPKEIRFFDKPTTNISLNNSTPEEVRIIGPQGQIFYTIKYNKAQNNTSFSRDANNKWFWTNTATPGEENVFAQAADEDKQDILGLLWRLKYKTLIRQNEPVVFDASHSLDPRGGRVLFAWDFQEGKILSGSVQKYAFASSGIHEIILRATSTAGTVDEKKIKIKVYPVNDKIGAGVVLSEIAPDENNGEEYIKIKNIGGALAAVSNWTIIANDKIFAIPTGTVIYPNDELVFYKEITGFTLNNTGGQIELRDDRDILTDTVVYGKATAGDKYVLAGDEWIIVKAPNISPSVKIAAKTGVKKSTAKIMTVISMDIARAREQEINTGVKVKGVVAVVPGIFGSQYFYITDNETGIQVYQYKKDFPKLSTGDWVEVRGVTSLASGIKRIRAAKASDIDILSINKIPSTTVLSLTDLNEDYLGALVKVSGEITEIKTNYMYIDDGTDEAMVYFKQGAKIDKKKFIEGQLAEITGIAEQTKSGIQIWPRSQDDIVITGESRDLIKKQAAATGTGSNDTAEKYLTATAGGITTLLLGFLARARGAMVLGYIKKAGSAVAASIKKNKA